MKYCVQILQKRQGLFLLHVFVKPYSYLFRYIINSTPYFPAILIPIMLKSITADLGVCGAG